MTSGQPASLKPSQIAQIVRDRLAGMEYKQIAIRVGCTPDQAIHYWRASTAYQPEFNRSASAKRREASNRAKEREAKRAQLREAAEHSAIATAAKATLQAEIAKAISERHSAPPYKRGELAW